MTAIEGHAVAKYATGTRLALNHAAPGLRVETWRHGAGRLPALDLPSTEVAVMLAGRVKVERTGDGRRQSAVGAPGMFWLCPAGVHECDIRLSDTMSKAVHLFLPADLLGATALEEFGLDPARVRLDYAGGSFDPLLDGIARAFAAIESASGQGVDRLLADSLRVTLAAHLLRNYMAGGPVAAARPQGEVLSAARMQRVRDLVDAELDRDLSLDEMARAACLSPFHFARSFRRTTGLPPHRFLLERRMVRARQLLDGTDTPLVEIAALCGFATQSGFTRAFRQEYGYPPGRYRNRLAGGHKCQR